LDSDNVQVKKDDNNFYWDPIHSKRESNNLASDNVQVKKESNNFKWGHAHSKRESVHLVRDSTYLEKGPRACFVQFFCVKSNFDEHSMDTYELKKYYKPLQDAVWTGRIDDLEDRDAFRWHQVVELVDLLEPGDFLQEPPGGAFCFLGFCCDKGVEQNLGRRGAANAPQTIRKEMANLPLYLKENTLLLDAGNVICIDDDMESAQKALAEIVSRMLDKKVFPILLGGGHEISFGHYNGINHFLSNRKSNYRSPGIINFDAHFDLRPYKNGANSGTMFRQIADECEREGNEFAYYCLGIQRYGNTASLFKKAEELNTSYVMAKDMNDSTLPAIIDDLNSFIASREHIYVTVCSDVISSAYAPGVSATQPFGLHPETVLTLLKEILKSHKVIGFDIAEVSPRFDEDNRTAKLAAIIVFAVINTLG
jgi:formiminoglutamase